MSKVSFAVSEQDQRLIERIVERECAWRKTRAMGVTPDDRLTLLMDVTACHANGTPLRLAELLAADEFNFMHDIGGIQRHIDRKSGKLRNHFLPRFTARPTPEAANA